MKLYPKNLQAKDLEGSPEYKRLYQAIEGKPFNKKSSIFTGNKDVDFVILQKIDDEDLTNICAVNSYVNDLCKNDIFWRNRLLNKYGFLLGTAEDIIVKYKPKDILWKEYYIWINSAVHGDQFFSYIYADVLHRGDVLKVLEYTYPEIFSDMDEIYELNEDFLNKIEAVHILPSLPLMKLTEKNRVGWLDAFVLEGIELYTKRLLMYVLATFALQQEGEKESRMLGKDKRYTYRLSVLDEKKLDPMQVIKNMMKQMIPYHNSDTEELEEIHENLYEILESFRQHFLEMGINLNRTVYEEEVSRRLKSLGIGFTLLTGIAVAGVILAVSIKNRLSE
jgi:hypothetical protein